MASVEPRSGFLHRFDRIWLQARRVQLWQAACWALLAALAGIALSATADYAWELSRSWRLAAMALTGVAAAGVALTLSVRSWRRWRRDAVASAIERVFPQLGQRIRTTVQFGDLSNEQIAASGATGALVTALADDTVDRAQPLPLDAVVPWKSLAFASLLAAAVGLWLAAASAFDWQWRIAAQRALLGDDPYTRLTVVPGSASVKEGDSLPVEVIVEGRIGEHLSFKTRRLDEADASWEEELVPVADGKDAGRLRLSFEKLLSRIRRPLEYCVTAGTVTSEAYRIDVRYPLKVAKIEATITPPAYTGLSESVVEGGDVTALVGSQVRLAVELDRAPAKAWLEMQDMNSRTAKKPAAPERLPLAIDGLCLTGVFEVSADKTFSIIAASPDGMQLADNKYRLRARQDEPPQVWFESPAESLEVHTLAEVLMRVRVSDDFGLSRAGVMFEVNNEEEYPLLAEDFAAAQKELQSTGRLSPQTRAELEKVLPLEHFSLSEKDSVLYYAFAEDIRPGSPQRTESDLRFIDIRPFRRQYRLLDLESGQAAQGAQLKTLEELISRQRYALNRAIRLNRTFEHGGQVDLSAVDSLTKFEGELATSTRELAVGLEARGIDETELLYQAEAAMLSAADSLSAGKYDTASLQMRDALKALIEGRNRLQIFIFKNPDARLLAQLRLFDRLQRQKLRRPKNDEEAAQQIVERLRELADAEDAVSAALAEMTKTSDGVAGGAMAGKPAEKPDSVEASSTGDPQAPDDSEGNSKPNPDAPASAEKDEPVATDGNSGEKSADGTDEGQGEMRVPDLQASRREIEDRQLDAALEAREVEKALERLKNATELAKQRMANAAKIAEGASAALERGAPGEARSQAGEAGRQFRELARQVAALVAKEQADRLAAAQELAAELARQQQEFKERLASSENAGVDGQPRPGEDRPMALAGQGEAGEQPASRMTIAAAEQIADKAQSLADVLAAAARADRPEDQESAKKVDELLRSLALKPLAERLGQLPDEVKEGKRAEARAAVDDGAERAEAAAEQLGALRRAIMAPRIDELAKLEEDLADLDQRLDELDADSKVTGWHLEADQIVERLEGAGVNETLRQEFVDELRNNGWSADSVRRTWAWPRGAGIYYVPPQGYRRTLKELAATVRTQMQELMLGDMTAAGDEPIPPQYQELVDRYYQVLASERQRDASEPEGRPRGTR